MASGGRSVANASEKTGHVTPIDIVKVLPIELRTLRELKGWLPTSYTKAHDEDLMSCIDPAEFKTLGSYVSLGPNKEGKKKICRKIAVFGYNRIRPHKSKPPTCILCLRNNQRNCGTLFWLPSFADFFAVHELCLVMNPQLTSVPEDSPQSELTRHLRGFQIQDIMRTSLRGTRLKCTVCHAVGALLGCNDRKCQRSYHLPCAIDANCALEFINYSCFCWEHLPNEKKEATEVVEDGQDDECIICSDPVKKMKKFKEVVKTTCCTTHYTHYSCMKDCSELRGAAFRCSFCNVNDTAFEKELNEQGIYSFAFDPEVGGDAAASVSNIHNTCYYAQGYAIRQPKCLCPKGPRAYDDTELDETKNVPFESLNPCKDCGVTCHRRCAGPPWSTYHYDHSSDIEEAWKCESCRGDPALVQQVQRDIVAQRLLSTDEPILLVKVEDEHQHDHLQNRRINNMNKENSQERVSTPRKNKGVKREPVDDEDERACSSQMHGSLSKKAKKPLSPIIESQRVALPLPALPFRNYAVWASSNDSRVVGSMPQQSTVYLDAEDMLPIIPLMEHIMRAKAAQWAHWKNEMTDYTNGPGHRTIITNEAPRNVRGLFTAVPEDDITVLDRELLDDVENISENEESDEFKEREYGVITIQ